jgi:UDP-4-amino-4,6-dideoxy-N-acetyl-beta-L-altrosamine N-acetyltransferase
MRPDDLDQVLSWRNHADIRRFMLTSHEITADEHRNWFKLASSNPLKHLLIVEERDCPLGYVQFTCAASGAASDWGFYVVPGSPKGSGKKLGTTALDYAFNDLALHKVCGQALDFNEASICFHEALGFLKEGVLREQHLIGGRFHDLYCFGLLKNEWLYKKST